jgi:hypothetical protein
MLCLQGSLIGVYLSYNVVRLFSKEDSRWHKEKLGLVNMEGENEEDEPDVQAKDNSIAVGGIRIGGDVSGNFTIGHQTTYITDIKSIEGLPPEPGDPPYMGLHYFTEENAELFFGRELLTDELVSKLETTHFLAIVGASGSGKSSVVRAGLVPALCRQGFLLSVLTPTGTPLESLAKGLAIQSESQNVEYIRKNISTNPDALYLEADRLTNHHKAHQLLLIVDQFKELFTGHPPEDDRKELLWELSQS